jgi:hypothetical protein
MWRTISRGMSILGTFAVSRQIKPRRVNLFQEPGNKRNPRSAESAAGEQDVFINGRETRGLRRGATCDR